MIYSYSECLTKYDSPYKLKRAVEDSSIFKIEDGIYSDEESPSSLEVIMKKYPNAILCGEYAFYVHDLTDVVPDQYSIATKSKAARINDPRVFQVYMRDDILPLGCITKEIEGVEVRIYDKERMLIELLRNKNVMPRDLYKEILLSYRKIVFDLDIRRIQEYIKVFPKSKMIKKAFSEEVL